MKVIQNPSPNSCENLLLKVDENPSPNSSPNSFEAADANHKINFHWPNNLSSNLFQQTTLSKIQIHKYTGCEFDKRFLKHDQLHSNIGWLILSLHTMDGSFLGLQFSASTPECHLWFFYFDNFFQNETLCKVWRITLIFFYFLSCPLLHWTHSRCSMGFKLNVQYLCQSSKRDSSPHPSNLESKR
jgi:hypothetical protein